MSNEHWITDNSTLPMTRAPLQGGDGDGEHEPLHGHLRHDQLAAAGDQHAADHHVERPLQLQHQGQLLRHRPHPQQGMLNAGAIAWGLSSKK